MTADFRGRELIRISPILAVGACIQPAKANARAPTGLIPHLGSKPAAANSPQAGIGVNSYLWRATLDTLAFMPLASADPFGGVVITDWYVNPEKPDERFKATVYILDTRLRADGLNVTVFKQNKDATGAWIDAPVAGQTDIDIENAILTRARQLRLSNLNEKG
jgi:hypothetical protein